MSTLAEDIRKKRRLFTLLFVVSTVIYGLVSYYGESKLSEQQLQYVVLGWRMSIAVISLWFGYAVGIKKQTTWFVSMLAILPVVSWFGVLYLLFKSGSMLVEAKKGSPAGALAGTKRDSGAAKGANQGKKNRHKK